MVTNEPTTGTPEQPAPSGPPPEAVDRLKREVAQAKAERDQFATVAQQALLVDKVHTHLRSRTDLTVSDRYEAAKRAAANLPSDVTDETLGQSVDTWLADMSNLFASTPTAQGPPQSPMAAGGDPAGSGEPPSSGPFKVNSQEFKDYAKQYGNAAAMEQIRNGMFVFSDANEAAQATAHSR